MSDCIIWLSNPMHVANKPKATHQKGTRFIFIHYLHLCWKRKYYTVAWEFVCKDQRIKRMFEQAVKSEMATYEQHHNTLWYTSEAGPLHEVWSQHASTLTAAVLILRFTRYNAEHVHHLNSLISMRHECVLTRQLHAAHLTLVSIPWVDDSLVREVENGI